jgi:hypothetical protein
MLVKFGYRKIVLLAVTFHILQKIPGDVILNFSYIYTLTGRGYV